MGCLFVVLLLFLEHAYELAESCVCSSKLVASSCACVTAARWSSVILAKLPLLLLLYKTFTQTVIHVIGNRLDFSLFTSLEFGSILQHSIRSNLLDV